MNTECLRKFNNLHTGQKAFIACNGPSLNDIPMEKLQGEIVFALNRGYLKKDLPITYLVTADKRVEAAYIAEIAEQDCIKFCHIEYPGVITYKLGAGKFSVNAAEKMMLGHTVTAVALQLAFFMGCDPVIIVGMDHSFNYKDTHSYKGKEYSNKDKDRNHFVDNYYPPGYRFRYQNLAAVENTYRQAVAAFEADGRRLYNASTYTELPDSVMPRISL